MSTPPLENDPRIVVVGDVMVDRYLTGFVHRISPEAPVPVLAFEDERLVPGGAANVAANAAALGGNVSLIGTVGTDEQADAMRRIIGGFRVATDRLVSDAMRPTIVKTRVMSGMQQIVRIDRERPGPLTSATEHALVHALQETVPNADVVILSDYAKGTLSPAVIQAAVETAAQYNCPVIVDPKKRDVSVYRGATLLTPNRKELSEATGMPTETDDEVAAAGLIAAEKFGGDILVTRAEHGMTLIRRKGTPFHVPAQVQKVFDVSGAGDTAIAALAVSIASKKSLETSVIMANMAAGLAVGKLGTSVVTHEELISALRFKHLSTEPAGAVVTIERAREIAAEWRARGEKIVFTNGCFDLVHPGHISLLDGAARQGDRLIVAMNSDASVRRLKGSDRPVQSEASRARVLGALRVVDLVVKFEEDTPLKAIELLVPDILVKGADYTADQVVGGDFVRARGGRVVLVPIVQGESTTRLVSRAKQDA